MHWDRAYWYGKEKRRNAAKEDSHVRKALRFGSEGFDEARKDAIFSALHEAEGAANRLGNGGSVTKSASSDVLARLFARCPRETKAALSSLRYMADEFPVEVVQFLHTYVNGASPSSTGAAAVLTKRFPSIMEETVGMLETLARASKDDTRAYFSLFTRI